MTGPKTVTQIVFSHQAKNNKTTTQNPQSKKMKKQKW